MRQPSDPVRTQWNATPDRSDPIPKLDLVRCTPGSALTALVLSANVHGVLTHYHHGRTQGHTIPWCDACNAGIPARWYGYLCVFNDRTGNRYILEVTDACFDPLHHAHEVAGTLRGCEIKLQRKGVAKNGPIRCSVYRAEVNAEALPNAIDVEAFIERMWRARTKPTGTADNVAGLKAGQDFSSDLGAQIAAERAKMNGHG